MDGSKEVESKISRDEKPHLKKGSRARIISQKLTGVPALSTHAAFTCGVSSTTAFFKMWLLIPADLAFDLLGSVHFASD